MTSIHHKAFAGVIWNVVERVGNQGAQFFVSIVLARLLMPAEFGLIAMVAVFLAISQTFVDSGFGTALIRTRDTTRIDESSIFYFNIAVALALVVALFFTAPLIAVFFKQPELTDLTRVLSFNLFLGAFGAIQNNLLTKRLNFKVLAKASLLSTVISGVVGVGLALRGFGVWSLVAQSLSRSFVNSALLWVLNDWRPVFYCSLNSLKKFFSFGSKLLVSGIINNIYVNMYSIILGRLYPAEVLGYYNRAQSFYSMTAMNVSGIVGKVSFPVLCTVNNDPEKMKNAMQKGIVLLTFVLFPMMIGLFVTAKPLISVLLTDKWISVVPILRVLTFMGVFAPLHIINLQVLNALGRSDLFLRLEIIKKTLMTISILISYRFGIIYMLSCHIILVSFVSFIINSYYSGKLTGYGTFRQFMDILPIFGVGIAMGLLVYPIQLVIQNNLAVLILQVIAGTIIYAGLARIVKISAMNDILQMLEPCINNKGMRSACRLLRYSH